jgi:hypothetical protein
VSDDPIDPTHPDKVEKKPAKKAAAKKTTKKAAPRARGDNRASGKPAATEEGEKSADEATSPVDDNVLPEEREEWFRNPGFQRMRTDWTGKDKAQMDRLQVVIDKAVFDTFPEAYSIMSDIYDIVREQEVNESTGQLLVDAYGFKVWKRNPLTNLYYEDWSLLSYRDREDFLFRITTQLFEWEQRAADLWTRAMFSKGMFVERFSIEYDAPIHGTIDDRNARGKEAAEERYFALLNSAVSRKAEALVRTMTNLQLRLKDTLGQ